MKMKKIVAVILALVLLLSLTACGEKKADESKLKIGAVLVGDEGEGYTLAHIEGIKAACTALGLDPAKDVVWKYSVPEDEQCKVACEDCIDQGCTLVITNSYNHQDYALQVAEQNPDIQIVAMTGDKAKASGLANYHNAFTEIYEARYVGGIVAGMKIKELVESGALTDANYTADGKVKIGYVGAYPYAEVISGFSAFFLGIKSVYPDVSMDVLYTSDWFSITKEKAAAEQLIGSGCVIIGQHADSTGAPSACEAALNAGKVVYSVGYNIDMLTAAPNAALTSPTNEWVAYYTYAIDCMLKGEAIAVNWCEGFDKDAVAITALGPGCAEGTQAKVDEAVAALKAGTLHPFAAENLIVNGEVVASAFATDTDGDWVADADEAIFDGYYHESYFQSAPAFNMILDGINILN